MKTFFIFIGIVSLLVSCQKELKLGVNQTTQPKAAQDTSSGEIQFTINSITYQFNENITAKQYMKYMSIEVQKDPSTFQITIFGDSVRPGAYHYSAVMFQQRQYDYIITERDFSLQVLSYQNSYLNATFHSGRVSNGIIKDLKVIPQ